MKMYKRMSITFFRFDASDVFTLSTENQNNQNKGYYEMQITDTWSD